MSEKKVTVCLKLDVEADKDIIDALNERFNRTEFIRICVRSYLLDEKLQKMFNK